MQLGSSQRLWRLSHNSAFEYYDAVNLTVCGVSFTEEGEARSCTCVAWPCDSRETVGSRRSLGRTSATMSSMGGATSPNRFVSSEIGEEGDGDLALRNFRPSTSGHEQCVPVLEQCSHDHAPEPASSSRQRILSLRHDEQALLVYFLFRGSSVSFFRSLIV